MSERIVSDPSQHGWVEVDGKWVWDASGGSIQDGDTEGQITTWGGTEWTPEGAVIVDANGNVAFQNGQISQTSPTGQAYFIQSNSGGCTVYNGPDGGNEGLFGTSTNHSIAFMTNNVKRIIVDTSGNATFSGDVDADAVSFAGYCGFRTASGTDIVPTDGSGGATTNTIDLGSNIYKYKNAYFSGTVDAAGFTVNGSPISGGGGGGGLPDGGYTYGWSITATDFIATSDERLKDNITPMPVGLIDDIKPVSWDWKDGGKSAGVVAQQLQAIGLDDYVHEGDDGQLGVNYQALTAILLAEVIDLKRRLAE